MKRSDFLNKTIRYVLLFVLAMIVFMLGRKVRYGADCTGCPEIANCPKNFDCIKLATNGPGKK